jgi:hypothetical protein
MPRFSFRAICLFLLLGLLIGCGQPPPEFGEVEGAVLIEGKPQRGLLVRFMPDPNRGNDLPINAAGETDAEGKYQLRYYYDGTEGKGAPVGWHRVLIEDSALSRVPQGAPLPPEVIPRSYGSPTTTPLQKEVKSGQQTIDFEIDF